VVLARGTQIVMIADIYPDRMGKARDHDP